MFTPIMRILAAICVIVTAALMADAAYSGARTRSATRASTSTCSAPDDFAQSFRSWVVAIANGTDASSIRTRQQIGIPTIADSAIYFVSDSSLCALAAKRHAALVGDDSLNPPRVYLLRIGSERYAAFNGTAAGEFFKYYFFDTSFAVVRVYAM